MRTLRQNKQRMYYSNIVTEEPLRFDGFDTNYDFGHDEIKFTTPTMFYANIGNTGNSVATPFEFGLNEADDRMMICTEHNKFPLEVGSIIWETSEIRYKQDGSPDETSADYRVVKIRPSLNSDRYIVRKIQN